MSWVTAAVALGSNLGDRVQHLERAVREIAAIAGVRVIAVSRWIETDALEGAAGQRHFMNGAIVIETRIGPRELLDDLHAIERAHGRERDTVMRHAPRTLDLDLVVHGGMVVNEPGLTVPHPRLAERAFVLVPLAEIAPDLVVPGTAPAGGEDRSVRTLLSALRAQSSRSAGG